MPRTQLITPRMGTAAAWATAQTAAGATPLLSAGEWAFETDTLQYKHGDGVSLYGALAYSSTSPRPSAFVVAASNSTSLAKLSADYVCTGSGDDITINTALAALPSNGGTVTLAPGDYYLGILSTSYINVSVSGTKLTGVSRQTGATIHCPASFAGPTAIKVTAAASCILRDVYVIYDNPTGTTGYGIWTLCNEPIIQNCKVQSSGGSGFVIDGSTTYYQALVEGCETITCGAGTMPGGDGFVVTANMQNAVLSHCWAAGGTGTQFASNGLLTTTLNSGTPYTSIAVAGGLNGAVLSGDQIVLVSQPNGLGASTYQAVTASAGASLGATSISVTSFTANATYTALATAVVDRGQSQSGMVTRYGFNIQGIDTHLDDCHPYRCYESGLRFTGAGNSQIFVAGGEYENNGYSNLALFSMQNSSITGTACYGLAAVYNATFNSCQSTVINGNVFEGGKSLRTILMAAGVNCAVAGNTFMNAVGSNSQTADFEGCNGCAITGNTWQYTRTAAGTTALTFFSNTNTTFIGNSVNTYGITYGGTNTGSVIEGNPTVNPFGHQTSPSVPSTTVPLTNPFPFHCTVMVSGGTVTAIAIGGTSTGLTSGSFRVPANQTITLTYSAAPSWTWFGD